LAEDQVRWPGSFDAGDDVLGLRRGDNDDEPPPSAGPLIGVGSGRCLDVPSQSHTNGTQLVIWDCNGGSNQQWTRLANGALQVYGNKCMDVLGHNTAPGAAVAIWDCTGGANQRWIINSDGCHRHGTHVSAGGCEKVAEAIRPVSGTTCTCTSSRPPPQSKRTRASVRPSPASTSPIRQEPYNSRIAAS
jgi:hypothetical protein